MTQKTMFWIVLGIAAGTWLTNMADVVKDVKEWHGAALLSGEFVSAAMKQTGGVLISALTGRLTVSLFEKGKPDT